MKKNKNPLAKKIKIAMIESGLNQTSLAKKLGITRQSLSEWLSVCSNPKIETVKKIARATNKPTNYFFEQNGNILGDNSTLNINSSNENLRLALLEKDFQILKQKVEILELKVDKRKK